MKEKNPIQQVVDELNTFLSDLKNKKIYIENPEVYEKVFQHFDKYFDELYTLNRLDRNKNKESDSKTAIKLTPQEKKSLEKLHKIEETLETYKEAIDTKLRKAQKETPKKTPAKERKKKFKAVGSDQNWIPL